MHLTQFHIHNFRNIQELKLDLGGDYNLFYGANGSGKTSLLEAIYYLSTARSFRSHLSSRITQYGHEKFTLYGAIEKNDVKTTIGVERMEHGSQQGEHSETKIHLHGQPVRSISEVARFFPVQILHQNSFELLISGPKYKRKFIDWGMFHVKHDFLAAWKKYKCALEQRNAILKIKKHTPLNLLIPEIEIWNYELAKWGAELHEWRRDYVVGLAPTIHELLQHFLGEFNVKIDYFAGWNEKQNLFDILQKDLRRDQIFGFTQSGPHRADLHLTMNNIPVQDCLSRGQQKVFIFAMYLAQGIFLRKMLNESCVYLIDDLAAELDKEKQSQIATILQKLNAQIFVTALEKENIQPLQEAFSHVGVHGNVFEIKAGNVF